MFKDPMRKWEPNLTITRAMDKILLLHADHEQNASTSTVRITATSNANPYACIAAGIASLWGPMHGGANEACVKMLDEIGSVENIPKYLNLAKGTLPLPQTASLHSGSWASATESTRISTQDPLS